jgi:hypothetical protein
MSWFSQIVGGFLGVAIAALLPGFGWSTALLGFTIGAGIGSYIDPVTPDVDTGGAPQMGDLEVTTAEEGEIIFEVLGTSMVKGNIFHYWGDRSEAVYGAHDVHTGWKYYLSWCQGFCLGPVDMLYAMYAGDNLVWEGELARPSGESYVDLSLSELDVTYTVHTGGRKTTHTLNPYPPSGSVIVDGNPWDFADADPDNFTLLFAPGNLTWCKFQQEEGDGGQIWFGGHRYGLVVRTLSMAELMIREATQRL